MLEICKASAGSGKTYKLVGEYLKVLFSAGTDVYRSILAVTFTNKATAEMKQRVLKELYILSGGGKSPYKEDLIKRYDSTAEEIEKKASDILVAILNDYSHFNISTIDKFFQQVLRTFAVDMGLYSSYNIELNDDVVLTAAVDELVNGLEDNPVLRKWLEKISIEELKEGRNWDSIRKLNSLGTELFKDGYKQKMLQTRKNLLDRSAIEAFGMLMKDEVEDFEDKCKELAEEAFSIMRDKNLTTSDFKFGGSSGMSYLNKLIKGNIEIPGKRFMDLAGSDVDAWCRTPKKGETDRSGDVISAYNSGLCELVQEIADLDFEIYFSAKEVLRSISAAGVLSDISVAVREYCNRNNLVLLSDTTRFLVDIIDGSDTPFIYERVGNHLKHYMLDEFQDTSLMQWMNFLPLMKESIDRAFYSLVVGDVKQSIYRWRGSDWNLLARQIGEDFRNQCQINTLEYNWRSSREVVQFNNDFFSALGELLGVQQVSDIYADTVQKLPENKNVPNGYVKINFFEKDNDFLESQEYVDKIIVEVEGLLQRGYAPCDIAFLVRKGRDGTRISEQLIARGYSIVTEDSLRISSSLTVLRIVDELRECESEEKSLYNICEDIIRTLPSQDGNDVAFVNSFMDSVLDYVSKYGSDVQSFLRWWDQEGKDRSISAPENRNSIRVMTIHKSKGLEFKAVILPYLSEGFDDRNNLKAKYIWCSSSVPPFDKLPLYPLQYLKALENTVFAEDYWQEKLYTMIDAINVAYVAFTRAVRELHIFAAYSEPKDASRKAEISGIPEALFRLYRHGDASCYEMGKPTTAEAAESGAWAREGEQKVDVFTSIPLGERLKLAIPDEEVFSTEDARMGGVVLHDIFSHIYMAEDVTAAVEDAVARGILPQQEREQVESRIRAMVDSVEERGWFTGDYELLTEVPVLAPGGYTYRPDRVMISGNTAVIVDYKFGHKKVAAYVSQVRGYMQLIRDMGFSATEGWLWYENFMEEVE